MKPQRLILGGMGLAGLAGWQRRGRFFKRAIAEYESVKRGDDTWLSIQFMKTMKVDRIAAGHLLDTFTDPTPEMLAALTMPTTVLFGEPAPDTGSAEDLGAAFPQGGPGTN